MTSIAEVVTDENLLGPWFSGPSWENWRITLKATFGEPLLGYERRRFRELVERNPPPGRVREAFFAIGRRGGKDSVASAIKVHAAVFGDYRQHLRPGERAVVLLLANTKDQASDLFKYIAGYFDGRVPLFTPLVRRITDDTIELTTGVDIIVASANYRSLRGKTIAVAIFNELAFWKDESGRWVNPDKEIYSAVLPALTTLRKAGSILIGISSVHRKLGLLYDRCAKYLGRDDPHVLVIKAPSRLFNETIPAADIEADLELDPEKGRAEWYSEWRADLVAFVDRDVVERLVDCGIRERPYDPLIRTYLAASDESGGGGADRSALSIVHRTSDGAIVQDLARLWRPPFSSSQVIAEKASILKAYGLDVVHHDHFAGGLPPDLYSQHGIRSMRLRPKSELYLDFLHLANSGRVRMLDEPVQISELCALERRAAWGGKETVDHPRDCHDDAVNVLAAAAVLAATEPARLIISDLTLARSRLPSPQSRSGGGDPGRIPIFL